MYSEIASNKRRTVLMMLVFIVIIGGLGWLFGQIYAKPAITPYVLAGSLV